MQGGVRNGAGHLGTGDIESGPGAVNGIDSLGLGRLRLLQQVVEALGGGKLTQLVEVQTTAGEGGPLRVQEIVHGFARARRDQLDRRQRGPCLACLGQEDGGPADLAGGHLAEGKTGFSPCLADGAGSNGEAGKPAALAGRGRRDYHTDRQPISRLT